MDTELNTVVSSEVSVASFGLDGLDVDNGGSSEVERVTLAGVVEEVSAAPAKRGRKPKVDVSKFLGLRVSELENSDSVSDDELSAVFAAIRKARGLKDAPVGMESNEEETENQIALRFFKGSGVGDKITLGFVDGKMTNIEVLSKEVVKATKGRNGGKDEYVVVGKNLYTGQEETYKRSVDTDRITICKFVLKFVKKEDKK